MTQGVDQWLIYCHSCACGSQIPKLKAKTTEIKVDVVRCWSCHL